jgi:hypothetical protein
MAHASYGNHSGVDGVRPDQNAQSKPEKDRDDNQPASGPHSKKELTNPDATPGTGALPPAGASDGTDSTSS